MSEDGSRSAGGGGDKDSIRARVEKRLREAERERAERRERENAPPPPVSRPILAPEPEAAPAREPGELVEMPESGDEEPAAEGGGWSFASLVATCFGIGRIPVAPGTFGSLAGLGAFLLAGGLPPAWQLGLLGASILLGWWAAGRHAEAVGRPDPNEVVVDEFCGMWLALALATPGWMAIAAAFLLFRALDILKPPPIRWLERLPGGLGIMADDLGAGLVVRLLVFVFLAM